MPARIEAFSSLVNSLIRTPEEPRQFPAYEGITTVKAIPKTRQNASEHALDVFVERRPSIFATFCSYDIPGLNLQRRCLETISSPRFQLLHHYVNSLDGDEVEVDTTKLSDPDMSSEYWDSEWKTNSQRGITHGVTYNRRIYPALARTVLKCLGGESLGDGAQFVDLFGGDGEFVQYLRSQLSGQHRDSLTFHIIDASRNSLRKARNLFKGTEKKVIVHRRHYLNPTESVFGDIPKPPKFVTAIGGICAGVISREEALGITGRIYGEMEQGGTFFVSGLSGCLLNSADFSKIGFKVLQMTIPEHVVYSNSPDQLYVLQK